MKIEIDEIDFERCDLCNRKGKKNYYGLYFQRPYNLGSYIYLCEDCKNLLIKKLQDIGNEQETKSCKNCPYLEKGYDEEGCYKLKCAYKHPRGKTITWAFDLYKGKKGSERVKYETPYWCELKEEENGKRRK